MKKSGFNKFKEMMTNFKSKKERYEQIMNYMVNFKEMPKNVAKQIFNLNIKE